MANLYHVTTLDKYNRIKLHGLQTGYTTSEYEPSIEAAEEELGISREDEEFWDALGLETMTQEQQARDTFNEVLSQVAPKKLPDHSNSLFFWTSKSQAESHASMMQMKPYQMNIYIVLTIDHDKVPCTCYGASTNEAELLFDDIMEKSGEWAPAPDEEDYDRWYEMGEGYYKTMKPWDGKVDEGLEILCPCNIPINSISQSFTIPEDD